ncbi:Hvo_1808 family surface protein [Natronoarchaeum rubrum]|uniref:Hvo_1808 family surface protein n=1 Tax=Natronoarchaeum rubrum TaxID=755311 RepID=UPI0021125AB1|nr:Hvo_1808 family surface protein [Natronoarchaeum rubrum]
MRQFFAVGAALLFVLSGVAAPVAAAPASSDQPSTGVVQPSTLQPAAADAAAPPDAALAAAAAQQSGPVGDCAAAPPADLDDPDADVLGWSEGYWYNESVAVNDSDGLNETELDALVGRTQARVEAIRCLEFEEDVEVDIRTRAEFRNASVFGNISESQRRFENVTYEALMLVGADEDAVEVQQENLGAGIGGYYEPTTDRLVVVSDDPDAVQFSEPVLAHELVHAVQDQQFNLTRYDARTIDDANAENGLIEGDARYVETLYRNACAGAWDGTCRTVESGGTASGDLANLPLYLLSYQPYSDGPAFVEHVRESGNWSAVDDVYDRAPNTSQEVMYPVRYPNETTQNLSAPNQSTDRWEQLSVARRPNYEIAGEPAVFMMFAAPTFDGDRGSPFVDRREFLQGGQNSLDPYDYSADVTDGWNGDRLTPYRNDDNETGYVWQLAWESGADAEAFASGYGDLLRYYDADPVDGRADTYELSGEFEGAYSVQLDDSTVRIVHAPTVEELRQLDPDAAPEGESNVTEADADRQDAIPGFGAAAATAALVGVALLAARRVARN